MVKDVKSSFISLQKKLKICLIWLINPIMVALNGQNHQIQTLGQFKVDV